MPSMGFGWGPLYVRGLAVYRYPSDLPLHDGRYINIINWVGIQYVEYSDTAGWLDSSFVNTINNTSVLLVWQV
jgi:hypothetical protein